MTMDLQLFLVFAVILGAVAFAAVTFARKANGFSTKNSCSVDCGCANSDDKLTSSKV